VVKTTRQQQPNSMHHGVEGGEWPPAVLVDVTFLYGSMPWSSLRHAAVYG
jgi:hypothetical protein